MCASDASGTRRAVNGPTPGSSVVSPAVMGLRDTAVNLVFLALATPEHPVRQVRGHITEVRSDGVLLSLDSPLPALPSHIRFGVEVFAPTGILSFQAKSAEPVGDCAVNLLLALPARVGTVQRRRFARIPFSGEIHFQVVHNGKALPGYDKGIGVDLSAGGVKMVTLRPLRPGQEILVNFWTPDDRNHRGILAKVIRVDHQAGSYAVACCFESLNESQETLLVQSVFRMQVRSAGR